MILASKLSQIPAETCYEKEKHKRKEGEFIHFNAHVGIALTWLMRFEIDLSPASCLESLHLIERNFLIPRECKLESQLVYK